MTATVVNRLTSVQRTASLCNCNAHSLQCSHRIDWYTGGAVGLFSGSILFEPQLLLDSRFVV
jgi:hypothetical protein